MRIHKEKLELLLTKSWAEFIDARLFINFITNCVQNLPISIVSELSHKNSIRISVSKCNIMVNDFCELWVDFVIPRDNTCFDVGTCEVLVKKNGELSCSKIIGTRNQISP